MSEKEIKEADFEVGLFYFFQAPSKKGACPT